MYDNWIGWVGWVGGVGWAVGRRWGMFIVMGIINWVCWMEGIGFVGGDIIIILFQ